MGFLARLRHLNTPRAAGSGRLWDNVNAPGSKGPENTTVSGNATTPAVTESFVRGPNPEPYLAGHQYKDPFRYHASPAHLQPEIPVEEPWAVSSVYVQNVSTSTAQPKNQVAPAQFQSKLKSLSPAMITQRDTEYDAANSHTLQRFAFQTPSQVYFNQRTPLPEYTTPSVPTNMVITGNNSYYPTTMKQGWEQQFVPDISMYELQPASAPPWLLSTPLNVKQITISEQDTRRPLTVGKAPKRKKSAAGSS